MSQEVVTSSKVRRKLCNSMSLSPATWFRFFSRRFILAVGLSLCRDVRGSKNWCMHRSQEWWDGVRVGLYGDEWWRENLRMSRETFEILCNELRPHIGRQMTRLRQPIYRSFSLHPTMRNYGKLLMDSVVGGDFHKRSVPLTGHIFPFAASKMCQTTITVRGTILF